MPYTFKPGTKILRKPELRATTGLSNSSIDRMVKSGDFPKPIQLGARAVGWPDFIVYEWLNDCAKSSEVSVTRANLQRRDRKSGTFAQGDVSRAR